MAKRRANGEGSLRKRKDGRWEGRYTAGTDPVTGKAIIKNVLGKTQAEVRNISRYFLPKDVQHRDGTCLRLLRAAACVPWDSPTT